VVVVEEVIVVEKEEPNEE